jgi:hypothetical protein
VICCYKQEADQGENGSYQPNLCHDEMISTKHVQLLQGNSALACNVASEHWERTEVQYSSTSSKVSHGYVPCRVQVVAFDCRAYRTTTIGRPRWAPTTRTGAECSLQASGWTTTHVVLFPWLALSRLLKHMLSTCSQLFKSWRLTQTS